MNLLPGSTTITFREKRNEYDDVFSFVFNRAKIQYEAGQYTHMLAGKFGLSVRELSFASAPSEADLIFTMHVGSRSNFKRYLMALRPGDTVKLLKAKGHFTLPNSDSNPIVFIAGGVGMAPIRSLLKEAQGQGRQFDRSLVQVQRGEYLFGGEVDGLSKYLKIVPEQLNRTITAVTQAQPTADYYICGSGRFLTGVLGLLRQSGIGGKRLHTENFRKSPVEKATPYLP